MYPWRKDDTFSEVLKVISPSNPVKPPIEAYEWARDRLILWQVKTSSNHCLPEIEATLSLLNALIKDRYCLDGNNIEKDQRLTNNCYDICTFYGMSIVKFCNLLPYYEMTKKGRVYRVSNKSKKTVRDLGLSLGLPSWVLECRHKTCHASTNSLVLLRQANYFALSWIFNNFWYKMLEEEEEANRNSENLSKLGHQVEKWLAVASSSKNSILKEKISQAVLEHPDQTFPIIVDVLIRESGYKISEFDMNSGELPSKIVKPYAKIFRLTYSVASLELFLHHIAEHFGDDDARKSRVSILWFKTITRCLSKQANDSIKQMLALPELKPETEIIVWQRLLFKATKRLTEYTPELIDHLSSLIPEDSIPSESIALLKELALSSIYVKNKPKKHDSKTNPALDEKNLYSVKTLADVTAELSKCDENMDTSS